MFHWVGLEVRVGGQGEVEDDQSVAEAVETTKSSSDRT